MTEQEQTLLIIRGLITSLPAEDQDKCNDLISKIKQGLASVDMPIAMICLAYIGAEFDQAMSQVDEAPPK